MLQIQYNRHGNLANADIQSLPRELIFRTLTDRTSKVINPTCSNTTDSVPFIIDHHAKKIAENTLEF
jgi:hypothetical protein